MKQKNWRMKHELLTPEELIELAQQQRAITKVAKDLTDLLKELEQKNSRPTEQFNHASSKDCDDSQR